MEAIAYSMPIPEDIISLCFCLNFCDVWIDTSGDLGTINSALLESLHLLEAPGTEIENVTTHPQIYVYIAAYI